jgi:hypothetical protein
MGGIVSVTIRRSDGKEYRKQRWTNHMPYYISNVKMLREDADHINEYVSYDNYTEKDYGLAPVEYGIVIVDFVTKQIVTKQQYTAFDKFGCG